MTITHVVCTYPPYSGGIGNVAAAFAVRTAQQGHTVSVITPEYKTGVSTTVTVDGVTVHRVRPLLKSGNAAFLPQVGKYCDDADVIHLHWPFFGTVEPLAWYLFRNPQKRFVMTYHMDFVPPSLFARVFSWPSFLFLPYLTKRAEAITVSSFDYAQHGQLKPLYEKYAEKFIEVPFGVSDDFLPTDVPDTFYATHGLDKNKQIVLFVGGLDRAHYFKGVSVLIDAYAALSDDVLQNSQLVIVGDGDLRLQYEQYARDKKINAHFLGALSHADLVFMYNAATCFVLPSINAGEAFGIVLVEAAACGIPSIASNLPGVRSVIVDGETGMLVLQQDTNALSSAMHTMLLNPEKTKQMGHAARARFEKQYQWDRIMNKLEGLYIV